MAANSRSLRSLRVTLSGPVLHAGDYAHAHYKNHRLISTPPDVLAQRVGRILAWWFPAEYCQLYINGRTEVTGKTVSNACTIICVLMCIVIDHHPRLSLLNGPDSLNPLLVSLFAEAMGEGNAVHKKLSRLKKLRSMNLTVPEALEACRYKSHSLKEWFYYQQQASAGPALGVTLVPLIHSGIHQWTSRRPSDAAHENLYMILIVDARSVVIMFQPSKKQILFFDSHSHLGNGAVCAFAPKVDFTSLRNLCQWYAGICTQMANAEPEAFELTFLYFRKCLCGYGKHRN